MKVIDNDKHLSLFQNVINYDHKKFYNTGTTLLLQAVNNVTTKTITNYKRYYKWLNRSKKLLFCLPVFFIMMIQQPFKCFFESRIKEYKWSEREHKNNRKKESSFKAEELYFPSLFLCSRSDHLYSFILD